MSGPGDRHRIGLLADVHANLPALRAVLDELDRRGASTLVCAGDVVGYGPHPGECLDLLATAGATCVAGNHELMLVGELPETGIHPWARAGLAWARERLGPEQLEAVRRLPRMLSLPDGVVVTHASLDDAGLYLRTAGQVRAELARLVQRMPDAWVLVSGHTHEAGIRDEAGRLIATDVRGRARLPVGRPHLVNPGSVGQSRGLRVLASGAVLEPLTGRVELFAVPYDQRPLRRDLAAAGLPRRAHHLAPWEPARLVRRVRGALTRSRPRDAG